MGFQRALGFASHPDLGDFRLQHHIDTCLTATSSTTISDNDLAMGHGDFEVSPGNHFPTKPENEPSLKPVIRQCLRLELSGHTRSAEEVR